VSGAAILIYYYLPTDFFLVAPKVAVLLAALAAVVLIEILRHTAGLELPTIRPYESRRIGSFVFYSLALVVAVLFFPLAVGAAVVLGPAWVDPLAGELRRVSTSIPLTVGVPLVTYELLAVVGLVGFGGWPWAPAVGLAAGAAVIAVAAERPKWPWVDDDLAMMILPAVFLFVTGVVLLGLPG